MDEFTRQNKVLKLSGCCGVNDADIWDEGCQSYHGRSHGRADVFFSEARRKACREKSAEAIVNADTRPAHERKKNAQQEVLRSIEGLNLIVSE